MGGGPFVGMTKEQALKSAKQRALHTGYDYVAIQCQNTQWMCERKSSIENTNFYSDKEKQTAILVKAQRI